MSDVVITPHNLTEVINTMPNLYKFGVAEGLFPQRMRSNKTFIELDLVTGSINIAPMTGRGAPGKSLSRSTRQTKSINIPHYAYEDVVMAEEAQDVRATGSTDALMNAYAPVLELLEKYRTSFDTTMQYNMARMIRDGKVFDVQEDGSLVEWLDLYTLLGETQQSVNFALGTTTTDIAAKAGEALNLSHRNLLGMAASGTVARVSTSFYNALRGHAKMNRDEPYGQATNVTFEPGKRSFFWEGITWIEETGTAVDPTGTLLDFIPDDEGRLYPYGPALSETVVGPGDWTHLVNQVPQNLIETWVKEEPPRGWRIFAQMNAIPLYKRPRAIIRLTMS